MQSRHAHTRGLSHLLLALVAVFFAARADAQVLVPQITTNKGCQETGENPVFAVGEHLTLKIRVGSNTFSSASAALVDHTPSGQTVVLSLGQIATNQTFSFAAVIGGSTGTESLVLRASRTGTTMESDPCTFTVVASEPTRTRTPTRTPTATRPPTTQTRTPVPGDLTGELHTNRGCREDGDTATFAIGEPIILSFRLDSDTSPAALASLLISRPNGLQTLISFGAVPTNQTLLLSSKVGPPVGLHTLRLRGSLGGPQSTLDTCTFLVGDNGFPTPTYPPTRTRTPTRTATPTRTFTPAPGACVGACSQAGTVSVQDLLTVIKIAAGELPVSACPSADPNGDDQVSLEEVLQAVNNALDGCP